MTICMSRNTMSILVQMRMHEGKIKILDSLVKKGIFGSRQKAIETFINEGLEKRGLINYEEVLSD